jgi:hypothetical protein
MRDNIATITELLGPDRLTGGKAKGGQSGDSGDLMRAARETTRRRAAR